MHIEAGDLVPADGRLLRRPRSRSSEAALTGESLPVAKGIDPVPGPDTPLGDRTDMVYMNTNVTRGRGEFIVTATGMAPRSATSRHAAGPGRHETPLHPAARRPDEQILVIAGVALLVSMVLNLARGETSTSFFTAAIAFAISAIPTGLPAVVTAILSLGTRSSPARTPS